MTSHSTVSQEKLTKMSSLFTLALGTETHVIERQTERPLTDAERAEARLVFGTSVNFDVIAVAKDPVLGVGGYARTLPHSINFSPRSFGTAGFMGWLIHELTHSWQYQHGMSVITTAYHAA